MTLLQSTLEDARAEAQEATAALAALDVERLALRGSTQRWFYTRGAIEWLHARRDERPSAGEEAADETGYELGDSGGGALDGARGGAGGVLVGAGVERVTRRGPSKDEPTAAQRLFEVQMDAVDETLRRSSELKQRRAGLLEARRAAMAVCHVIEQCDELSKWDEIPVMPVPNRPELCVQKGCCSSACKRSPRRPPPSHRYPIGRSSVWTASGTFEWGRTHRRRAPRRPGRARPSPVRLRLRLRLRLLRLVNLTLTCSRRPSRMRRNSG